MPSYAETRIKVHHDSLSAQFSHQLPKNIDDPEGEKEDVTTILNILYGQPLPFHIVAIHAQNPQVVPTLVAELETYLQVNKLEDKEQEVLQFALTLLRELAAKKIQLTRDKNY